MCLKHKHRFSFENPQVPHGQCNATHANTHTHTISMCHRSPSKYIQISMRMLGIFQSHYAVPHKLPLSPAPGIMLPHYSMSSA